MRWTCIFGLIWLVVNAITFCVRPSWHRTAQQWTIAMLKVSSAGNSAKHRARKRTRSPVCRSTFEVADSSPCILQPQEVSELLDILVVGYCLFNGSSSFDCNFVFHVPVDPLAPTIDSLDKCLYGDLVDTQTGSCLPAAVSESGSVGGSAEMTSMMRAFRPTAARRLLRQHKLFRPRLLSHIVGEWCTTC